MLTTMLSSPSMMQSKILASLFINLIVYFKLRYLYCCLDIPHPSSAPAWRVGQHARL